MMIPRKTKSLVVLMQINLYVHIFCCTHSATSILELPFFECLHKTCTWSFDCWKSFRLWHGSMVIYLTCVCGIIVIKRVMTALCSAIVYSIVSLSWDGDGAVLYILYKASGCLPSYPLNVMNDFYQLLFY